MLLNENEIKQLKPRPIGQVAIRLWLFIILLEVGCGVLHTIISDWFDSSRLVDGVLSTMYIPAILVSLKVILAKLARTSYKNFTLKVKDQKIFSHWFHCKLMLAYVGSIILLIAFFGLIIVPIVCKLGTQHIGSLHNFSYEHPVLFIGGALIVVLLAFTIDYVIWRFLTSKMILPKFDIHSKIEEAS
ncbi:MAG: hypothetical protein LBI20_02185 [Holosporales bacterium]|jgi:hypothetical protein|nr:hypothetical protein [Holosporales bacterium]